VVRKRKLSKKQAEAFLATPRGQAWLEEKLAGKQAARPDPGPPAERLTRTKFPFAATINGEQATVWPDHVEYEDDEDLDEGWGAAVRRAL